MSLSLQCSRTCQPKLEKLISFSLQKAMITGKAISKISKWTDLEILAFFFLVKLKHRLIKICNEDLNLKICCQLCASCLAVCSAIPVICLLVKSHHLFYKPWNNTNSPNNKKPWGLRIIQCAERSALLEFVWNDWNNRWSAWSFHTSRVLHCLSQFRN